MSLRRLDRAHDPLQAQTGIVEDDLDWRHALGGAARNRAAATDKLGELRTQPGLHAIEEPDGEGAAFAGCEAQPRVDRDGQLHATADHLSVATSMRHHTSARRGQGVVRRADAALVATERAEIQRHAAHVVQKPHAGPFLYQEGVASPWPGASGRMGARDVIGRWCWIAVAASVR